MEDGQGLPKEFSSLFKNEKKKLCENFNGTGALRCKTLAFDENVGSNDSCDELQKHLRGDWVEGMVA